MSDLTFGRIREKREREPTEKELVFSMAAPLFAGHGGACCGIRHFRGLGCSPDTVSIKTIVEGDRYVTLKTTVGKVFRAKLDHCLHRLEISKASGIIEVVLKLRKKNGFSQHAWIPVLEEYGFKAVNTHKNSNSSNFIRVYHLNYNYRYSKEELIYND